MYNPNMINNFLNNASLPKMKDNEKAYLETDVQEMEVKAAIKALTAGKAPAKDSCSREFYKCFQDVLSPILTLFYKDIIATQSMLSSMSRAVISLLPKPGKDLPFPQLVKQ